MTQNRLLNETDAAQYLAVSRAFLRKSRVEGNRTGRAEAPPFIRAGRMIRYDIADLDLWVERHRNDGRTSS